MSEPTQRELPAASFSSFVASLAASALAALGEGADGATDLALARHTIDLLGLLKEKTAGNLDHEETQLLDALLYETRMKFVQKTGS